MKYNPDRHHRRSIRLSGYDYTSPGAYFITICTHHRERLFGEITNGTMQLNPLGERVQACWLSLPRQFSRLRLDEYVVMPDHFHGILVLPEKPCRGDAFEDNVPVKTDRYQSNASPLRPTDANAVGNRGDRPIGTQSGSIGAIIQNFKSVSTRRINQIRHTPGIPVWQRSFYDHVIRNDKSMHHIRHYIQTNPSAWKNQTSL
ncbi:MAG: transposase [Elainellaceae cyanobacterium]